MWPWCSEKTVLRYFCSIYAFRSQTVPRRTKENHFPNVFYHLEIFLFQFQAKIITFCKHRFSEILKTDFSRIIYEKTAISACPTVDKSENAKNNEIKILVWPPESLKSQETVFSDNHGHKLLEKCETQASFRNFSLRKKCLYFKRRKWNHVKIRIWSKSLGTRPLRTTGLIEIPWRPKILSPKS